MLTYFYTLIANKLIIVVKRKKYTCLVFVNKGGRSYAIESIVDSKQISVPTILM